ncbi:SDR family NAD(P)-dependent oxidoreductase [Undibacterium flavidum]|uniref:SDR family NAD(P)-dependent oxidoreductase n=1 Tax=Undibacterium flavidum TaxID=2762297 RepID=A0ABR6Y6H3_9BURK|nr:SDR family NAD(P)-dependent oxidoreductase [Undibacterium flavidum]MBC3872216.1 SDR family NAD(P)-dependent oxidoreductase [Undibacterium flavidum]
MSLHSFPKNFRACVIGASGAIGAAFVQALQNNPHCASVVVLHRNSVPAIDLTDEHSIEVAAEQIKSTGPFHLIIHAAGILHQHDFMPEKKLGDLNIAQMQTTFMVNTFGPAMVLRHFSALLDKQRGVFALLSAKVGSIEDNRLGGWYSYRASKAALNMMIKTAAIEIKRTQPNAVVIAMHPGTVNSALSRPFRGEQIGRPPAQAASEMLEVIDRLQAEDSASFISYNGERLPW